ncbi:MAG TPA: hypothetical protein VMU34_17200 [Mycobacterium sp.]|nr:hypothetical protein [Mycobacterium sp.]
MHDNAAAQNVDDITEHLAPQPYTAPPWSLTDMQANHTRTTGHCARPGADGTASRTRRAAPCA